MSKQFETVETIEGVIEKLGGPAAVRQLTNRKAQSAVLMWKNRNRFPAVTYTTMQDALRERGFTAPGRLWGMP